MGPSISYAITTHNEGSSVQDLIDHIKKQMSSVDELVIVDDYSTDQTTLSALSDVRLVYKRKLNNNFSSQKNYLNSKCTKDYIFQFDGDELPSESLLSVAKHFVKNYQDTDLFWIPRDNQLFELDMDYINKWGWVVDTQNRINYPDYQGRLFKNSDDIRWTRPVHEIISGHETQRVFPINAGVDILHTRHMSRQIQSNAYYDENF
jgi:glycosyltransferase involved in cell wall biosynthesis